MQHRIWVTVDVEGDAYKAAWIRDAMTEAAAKLDAELIDDSVERVDIDAKPDASPYDNLLCWCGESAHYAIPPTDATPRAGHWSPSCLEHVTDGYVGLAQFDEDQLHEKLGLA